MKSMFDDAGQPNRPRDILIFLRRKRLDSINFRVAAKKQKQFTLPGTIFGRKRRIRIIVRKYVPLPNGERVTVDLLSTSAWNRPNGELWIPKDRNNPAGILTPRQ